jgi:lipopolysaccharide biosynthesis regulator YciM
MNGQGFITASDLSSGVAFLRSIADDDQDALSIAIENIENVYAVLGQFSSCLIEYVQAMHECGFGPSLDDVLQAWGIESARLAEERRE